MGSIMQICTYLNLKNARMHQKGLNALVRILCKVSMQPYKGFIEHLNHKLKIRDKSQNIKIRF